MNCEDCKYYAYGEVAEGSYESICTREECPFLYTNSEVIAYGLD